jgi:hypothetical protein
MVAVPQGGHAPVVAELVQLRADVEMQNALGCPARPSCMHHAADTMQAHTMQTNSVQADSVQADSVQADSVQADTVQADTLRRNGCPRPSHVQGA